MNKKYFDYLKKSKKGLIVVICVIYALFYITSLITNFDKTSFRNALISSGVVLAFAAYLIVPILFRYVHNKKAVDSFFSLPITRKQMLETTIIFGLIIILVPFLIIAIIAFIASSIVNCYMNICNYLLMIAIIVISVCAIVIFNTSLYLEANNHVDGVIMIGAYAFIPVLFLIVLTCFQDIFIYGFESLDFTNTIGYISLPFVLGDKAIALASQISKANYVPNLLNYAVCLLWHMVVAFMSLEKNYVERKVERAESISNRFFCYPFVINIFAFCLIIITTFEAFSSASFSIVMYCLIFACYIIAKCIYRRRFGVSIKDAGVFLLYIALSIVFCFVTLNTKAFNIPYSYDKNPENISANYWYTYNKYWAETYPEYEQEQIENFGLVKKILDEYPDIDMFAYRFSILVDKDEMESKKELVDIIQSLRKRNIDYKYESVDNFIHNGMSSLDIQSNFDYRGQYIDYGSGENTSYNNMNLGLTEEELKTICKYVDVVLEIDYASENKSYIEMPLSDLLND